MSDTSLVIPTESLSFESSTSQLRKWQAKLLSGTLLIGVVTAILVLGLSFFDPGNPNQRILIIGSIVLGFGSIILFLLRNTSFWVRSIVSLIFFFIFVNSIFFFYGWTPASMAGLIGFVAISTALLFRRSIRYGLIVSVLTLVLWAALAYSGSIGSAQSSVSVAKLFNDGLIVFVIGFFIYFALNQLKELYLSKIDENQEKVKEILEVNSKYQELTKVMQHHENLVTTLSSFSQNLPKQADKHVRIQHFIDQMSAEFGIPWIFIYLIDIFGERLELKFGTSEIARELIEKHHHFSFGSPNIVSQSFSKNQVQATHFNQGADLGITVDDSNGEEDAIAIPIISKDRVIGSLLLITNQVSIEDSIDRSVFQIIAHLLAQLMEDDQELARIPSRETRLLSFEDILEGEQSHQFAYPEGELSLPQEGSIFTTIELKSPSFRPIGKMKIPGRNLDQEEIETVNTLAAHAAIAISRLATLTKVRKAVVSEEKSKEIANRFLGKKKMEDVLRAAVTELGKLPDVLDAGIALVSPDETIATPRTNGRKNDINE